MSTPHLTEEVNTNLSENFVVPGSGGSKSYPYLPPRIDEEKYQVNIPTLLKRESSKLTKKRFYYILFILFFMYLSFRCRSRGRTQKELSCIFSFKLGDSRS